MHVQMIRRGLVVLAAAGAASGVHATAALAQAQDVERIVVTAPRTAMFRPTLQVIQGIREHVVDCLDGKVDLPRNAPEVRLRVRIKADGTLDGPPVAQPEPTGLGDDDYMRAVVAARQALYRCEPYDFLPPGEYQHWEELDLVFRPAP